MSTSGVGFKVVLASYNDLVFPFSLFAEKSCVRLVSATFNLWDHLFFSHKIYEVVIKIQGMVIFFYSWGTWSSEKLSRTSQLVVTDLVLKTSSVLLQNLWCIMYMEESDWPSGHMEVLRNTRSYSFESWENFFWKLTFC